MTCPRCTAISATGQRCKNNSCVSRPMCWVHTKSKLGLRVKKSKIPGAGLGLYAANNKTFKKDQKIVNYTGKRMTAAAYELTDSNYGFAVNNGIVIDSSGPRGSVARYANDCLDKNKKYCKRNNAYAEIRESNNSLVIKADHKIKPNQEIYLEYGDDFWNRDTTAPKKKAVKTIPKEFAIKTIKKKRPVKPIPNWVLQHKAAKARDLANAKTAAKLKKARAKKRKAIETVWRIGTP
jgi:hypothetical protein